MTEYQREILKYLEKNIILQGKEIFFGYDEKSVVIIDKNTILHFRYGDKKIFLVDSEFTIRSIEKKYRKTVLQ